MRLFQNCNLYPSYVPRLRRLAGPGAGFEAFRRAMLEDLYAGMHLLQPVIDEDPSAFLANGHDAMAQRAWARAHGMSADASLDDILLAQVEEHRTEVFYNLDPISFPGSFARRLPGSVKARIAWRAAPSGRVDFTGYQLMVCNFPGILASFARLGLATAVFSPSYDHRLDQLAARAERPIDVAFVGTFSRHHARRTEVLRAVARLADRYRVAIHLETSRFTRLAELPLVSLVMPQAYKRPQDVRRIAGAPAFGRDLYETLGRARIVVNGAIDMSGEEKGNIRCFEALGVGCLLLTDAGRYPQGMEEGRTMQTYASIDTLGARVAELLAAPVDVRRVADAGHAMLRERYSKASQWQAFESLVARVAA